MTDWAALFAFDVPFWEIFVRGSVVYLALVLMMRFGSNRGLGTLGVSDMLVVVLIADASQNAMAGEYHSISDGLVLVSVIIMWDYLIDWLCFKIPRLDYLLQKNVLCLVKNGHWQMKNMRRQFITKEELLAQFRLEGVEDVKQVKLANLEANGEISVVKYKD